MSEYSVTKLTDFPQACDFFDKLGLPVPEYGECYEGTSSRKLVFLNPFGLVIRITPENKLLGFDNAHFLKPLFARHAHGYQFAIDPGIDCPLSDFETVYIYHHLETKHGIRVSDGKPENLGYLPGFDGYYPLMIDLDQMVKLDENAGSSLAAVVHQVQQALNIYEDKHGHKCNSQVTCWENGPDPQDIVYGPLKKIMNKAWPADAKTPDPEMVKEFFKACRDYKSSGRLLSRWTEFDYNGTSDIANAYEKRLTPFVKSIT